MQWNSKMSSSIVKVAAYFLRLKKKKYSNVFLVEKEMFIHYDDRLSYSIKYNVEVPPYSLIFG